MLAIARQEARVLIVSDRKFGELIVQRGAPHAGVIYFRLSGAALATKLARLHAVLVEHQEDLRQGAFLVVTHADIRLAHRRP